MSTGSVSNDHLALVDFRQEHGSEIDGPDPVVGFFEADVMLFERVGDEEQLVLQPGRAGVVAVAGLRRRPGLLAGARQMTVRSAFGACFGGWRSRWTTSR